MNREELIEQTKQNIWTAVGDYDRYTSQHTAIEDIGSTFVDKMAEDCVDAKQKLRDLFSKSPVWDEKLDALVINGTRTHDPDKSLIQELGQRLLCKAYDDGRISLTDLNKIIEFFVNFEEDKADLVEVIERVAPKAYAKGKKRSRIFKSICTALGVADETAGSEFQRVYAQFADELSTKRIGFKLFVSINPAHFITMSNPKYDSRGDTLTSCHSFNSNEYEYNGGCTGYARDEVSFIAFTAADPKEPETLNNRKTTRQVYAYEPGNGVLLQSRLYNTSGGTRGAQSESKLYRDLIQREISALEGVPNLWKTFGSTGEYSSYVETGEGFIGYPDWRYSEFDAKISFRDDGNEEKHPLIIGRYARCCSCGCETDHRVFCYNCDPGENNDDREYCECCEEYYDSEDMVRVHDRRGNEIWVCSSCCDNDFYRCEHCGEYHTRDNVTEISNGDYYCNDCLEEYCVCCDDCGKWVLRDEVHSEVNDDQYICNDCFRDGDYFVCEECGKEFSVEHLGTDEGRILCEDCYEEDDEEEGEDD